jgi:hypothetical protein
LGRYRPKVDSDRCEVDWTADQVNCAVQMVTEKVINNDSNIKITRGSLSGGDDFTIQSTNINGPRFYVSVYKNGHAWISLDKAYGMFRPAFWRWHDKEVKATIKRLYDILNDRSMLEAARAQVEQEKYKTELAMKSLLEAFPDIVNREFEKHVLESKDDAKKR